MPTGRVMVVVATVTKYDTALDCWIIDTLQVCLRFGKSSFAPYVPRLDKQASLLVHVVDTD